MYSHALYILLDSPAVKTLSPEKFKVCMVPMMDSSKHEPLGCDAYSVVTPYGTIAVLSPEGSSLRTLSLFEG